MRFLHPDKIMWENVWTDVQCWVHSAQEKLIGLSLKYTSGEYKTGSQKSFTRGLLCNDDIVSLRGIVQY